MPLDDEAAGSVSGLLGERDVDELDPEADGLEILQVQRRMPLEMPIGGFVQLTSVTTASVRSRVIHRWS